MIFDGGNFRLFIFITILLLLFSVIIVVIIEICNSVRQKKFVKKYSNKFKEISNINTKYEFDFIDSPTLKFNYDLKSKKQFDNFSNYHNMTKIMSENKNDIDVFINVFLNNQTLYKKYLDDIRNIDSTSFNELPKVKYIDNRKFNLIEEKLCKKITKAVSDDFLIIIEWQYTSPAGRNHYEDDLAFNYRNLKDLYLTYYHEDVNNMYINSKIKKISENYQNILIKKIYKIDNIIELFKKDGNDISLDEIFIILEKFGYNRWKDSDFFVISQIKNYRDLILEISEENGLIIYDNFLKDEEYDKAIKDLEECGLIAPINSLSFLKLNNSLNYNDITYDDIKNFREYIYLSAKKWNYFSIKSFRNNKDYGIKSFDQFDDCFIYSLLKNSKCKEVAGLKGLFTLSRKNERVDFLAWRMSNFKSVDIYDFCYEIKEEFGIEYQEKFIIYDIEKNTTDLYYNKDMDKIYSKKDYFFDELRERGVL